MRLTSWLTSLRRGRRLARRNNRTFRSARTHRTRNPSSITAEVLEDRTLLSVTSLFIDGELSIVSDAEDDIAISADALGEVVVTVNGAVQSVSPPVSASIVESIVVEGSDEENSIDLSGVKAADFSFQDVGGNGVSILVEAGNGDDTIVGTDDLDATIRGGDGNDVIDLDFGRDLISYPAAPKGNRVEAGDGNDTLTGGPGDDTLLGEDGNDIIDGMLGDDWIDGHDGVDDIDGGLGNDTLLGGNGTDSIDGGMGQDSLNGGSGDDLLIGGFGNDTIRGGSGSDLLFGDQENPGGQAGDDSLFGQGGSDSLFGGGGGDSLNGGPGNDLVQSLDEMFVTEDSPPDAVLPPTAPEPITNQPPVVNDDFAKTIQEGRALVDVLANDVDVDGGINVYSITITNPPANGTAFVQENGLIIFTPEPGFSGIDSVTYTVEDYYKKVSLEATLVVETTPLDSRGDAISGSSGDDSLYGNFGADSIWGGSGNDVIHGLPNADVLKGQSGNDTLCGGGGADWMGGNAGNDLIESVCPGPGLAGPEIFISDSEGLVQTAVDVLMILDISLSTDSAFVGTPVGDLNNDGTPDTILDAEIAGLIALNDQLIADGTNAQVGIVWFNNNAGQVDMDTVAAGMQIVTTPTADVDGNGVPDVEDQLRLITAAGFTAFEPALQLAEQFFTALSTQPGSGVLVFLSDGDPNDDGPPAAYADEVVRLRAMGMDLRAFAVGAGANTAALAIIDPTVIVITSTDEMINALGSLGITTVGGIPFVVELTKYGTATMQVDYSTVDGSLLDGVHYVGVSGTLVFLPGDTQKTVLVDTIPNALVNPGDNFFMHLSNPVNVVINDGVGEALFSASTGSAPGPVPFQAATPEYEVMSSGSGNESQQQSIDMVIAQAEQLEVGDYVAGEMVVFFEHDLAPTWTAREEIVEEMGGEIVSRLELLHAAVVRLTNPAAAIVDDLWDWIDHPSVAVAEPNLLRQLASRTPDDPRFYQQWGLDNTGQIAGGMPDADVDAPEAWDLHRGSDDIVVAVIDSGIDHDHLDLVDNMWVNTAERDGAANVDDDGNGFIDDIFGCDLVGASFRTEDGVEKPICVEQADVVGHGTHVAGIIGAQGNNNKGIAGVNWDVSLMELQATNAGGIDLGAAYQSMAYAFYRKHTYILEQSGQPANGAFYGTPANIVAVNASFSATSISLLEYQMIRYLGYVDITFVAAAGNSDLDIDVTTANYPASYDLPNIISVAATNDRDELADYSNYGLQSVDLAAPGGTDPSGSCPQENFERGYLSSVPTPSGTMFSCGNVVDYGYLSGTSMAASMVTGAVALLSAYNPQAPGWLVKQSILSSVDVHPTLVGTTLTGGRLNLFGAMQAITPDGFLAAGGSGTPPVFSTIDIGDTMIGHSGNDTLLGAGGDDSLNGNGDRDTLDGGLGSDNIVGGSGDDRLNGNGGDDTLDGQGGADEVFGDAGDDTLVWQHGGGSDNLDGGSDYDVVHARGDDQANLFGVQENQLDLTYQTDARLQLTDGTHTTNVWFSISEVEFQPGDGDDTVIVGNLTHVPSLLVRVNGGNDDDVLDANAADPGVVRLMFDGEDGNDTITGSVGEDTILGGDGDDLIAAGGSRDTVHGGEGDDVIGGEDGNDLLHGDAGFDTLNGDAGDDELFGGSDQDMLVGGIGNDTISGDAGHDTLNGKSGNDSLLGGAGTDRLYGGVGDDTLDGGRDNDSMYGNNGNDRLLGDHGNDSMKGGRGDDTLVGGDGHDQMFGERGDDQLGGGDGDDTINGARGDDIMLGGDGNDTLLAGSGADVVLGNLGDDYVKGQGGTRDTIAGGEGADMVFGLASEIDEAFNVSNALMIELDAV